MFNGQENHFKKRKTILVVEDDESMSEVIQLTLSEEPSYTTVMINSPAEALHIAQHVKPDLFIIDYLLSGMNGIELHDKLHAIETLKNIPTIITSASLYTHADLLAARNLTGLEKPFDLDVFLETIKQVLA